MNQFQTQANKYTGPLAIEASDAISDLFGENRGNDPPCLLLSR